MATHLVVLEIIVFGIIGVLIHEVMHLFFGLIFGGKPYITSYYLKLIPEEIDFKRPNNLSNWQIRITGGCVYIFPLILIFGALMQWAALLGFGLGGSALSWQDLLASKEPAAWRRFTRGESINKQDFE